ncbi:MAG: hypothetical protein JW847_02240 [Candidatus Omnitrophica bacterium]|nr:hypothetical protein [Candidatus Omnitrophota bacterium]
MADILRTILTRKTLIFFYVILLLIANNVFAAVIDLNSGDIVGGVIVERTDEWIKIDTGIGIPITYYLDEIKAIDGVPVNSPENVDAAQAVASLEITEAPGQTDESNAAVAPEMPETEKITQVNEALKAIEATNGGGTDEALVPGETVEAVETSAGVEEQNVNVAAEAPKVEESIPIVEKPGPGVETEQAIETKEVIEERDIAITARAIEFEGTPQALEAPETAEDTNITITTEADEVKEPAELNVPDIETDKSESNENRFVPVAPSKKDTATLEGIDVFQEQASPLAIKPKEAPSQTIALVTDERIGQQLIFNADYTEGSGEFVQNTTQPENESNKNLVQEITEHFGKYAGRFNETKEGIRKKWPFIKEKLYSIPVKIRRGILILLTSFMAVMYVLIFFPLMKIAQKLQRKYSWLIWVPIAQILYFVYMAKRPVWLAILFLIPLLNVFIPLIFFMDLLKLLEKPRWLILFIIIPGVNIFTLWYLAISKSA